MSDVDAFTALAEKLPPDQRARLLAMSIQLKNLPPDDELSVALGVVSQKSITVCNSLDVGRLNIEPVGSFGVRIPDE
ncbi:MAG: hypothetical protein ACI9DF_003333 [Verrucomicrobiales bacterium]|jgi:hypothetical protein